MTVVHRSLAWTVRQRDRCFQPTHVCSQCALSRACRFRYNALVNTPNVLRGEARNARRWPTISCELIRSSYPHAQCTLQHPLTRDAILRGMHIEAGTEMATASASLVAVLAPAAPNSSLSLASLLHHMTVLHGRPCLPCKDMTHASHNAASSLVHAKPVFVIHLHVQCGGHHEPARFRPH